MLPILLNKVKRYHSAREWATKLKTHELYVYGKESLAYLETKAELAKSLYWLGHKAKAEVRTKSIFEALIKSLNPELLGVFEGVEESLRGSIRLKYLEALADCLAQFKRIKTASSLKFLVSRNLFILDVSNSVKGREILTKLNDCWNSLI